MTKIIPTYDYIVLKEVKPADITIKNVNGQTTGKIIMPQGIVSDVLTCTVEAVGEGRLLFDGTISPCRVKVGDKVLVSSIANKLTVDRIEYRLVQESEIMVILEEDEKE